MTNNNIRKLEPDDLEPVTGGICFAQVKAIALAVLGIENDHAAASKDDTKQTKTRIFC